jgi:hypothetical protein
MEKNGIRVLKIDQESWWTPAMKYKLDTYGEASLERIEQAPGLYRMEGVDGYGYYYHLKPIKVTCLKIGKKTWMVDDPLHWIGMQRLAQHANGKTLCVGLGLGLVQHALASMDKAFDTCEMNNDVYTLMVDKLPPSHGKMYLQNVFELEEKTKVRYSNYDTIILDIWAGNQKEVKYIDMLTAMFYIQQRAPNTQIFIWGIKDPQMNPACKKVE